MSRIDPTTYTPAEESLISATGLTSKFSEVEVATAALDDENVSAEGIDARNLDSPFVLSALRMNNNADGSPHTYSSVDAAQSYELTHGNGMDFAFPGGLSLESGDILRLHYQVYMASHNEALINNAGARTLFVVYPMWDLTSTSLVNMEVLPEHTDIHSSSSVPLNTPYQLEDFDSSGAYKTHGYAVYPTYGYLSGSLIETRRAPHGVWNYRVPSALTLYGFRFYFRGPFLYQHYSSGGSDFRAWVYATSYAMNVTFERGQASFLALRGGAT
ncbi:MAG: hypothetical protein D6722_25115 [Bacteroidetes bacterium]|nr:MAG: hypothetical protein D6722_25115 [Bacteroidota bacterium]